MKRKRMLSAGLTALLLLFFTAGSSLAQVLTVNGTVVDARTNTPLPGVNIVVQGTTVGTITDVNGKYSIRVENPSASLVFSYVGYVTQTIPVNNRSVIDVAMSEEVVALNELVVIGYGTQRRADLTGSIAVVDVPEVSKTATNDITKALQGQVAGVSIQSGGDPGAVPQILIRGIGSFNNNTPLYIVDGAVTPINDLPLASVESIQVLKDASAAAIYGSRAANGVIIITTKRGAAGKLNVTYDGYYGWQNITKRYDVCNREEYQMLVNEATRNAQVYDPTLQIMPANDPTSPYFVDDVDTDWQKEVFKTGNINQHNLGLSGGSENSTFNVNLNYFNQTPTVVGKGPSYKRYGVSINSDHKSGHFRFGESVHYTYVDQRFMTFLHDGTMLLYTVNAIPTLPVYDPTTIDGYSSASKVIHGSYTANVVGMNNLIDSKTDRYRFVGSMYGEYEFFEGLKYKLNLSFERTDWRDFWFKPVHDLGWFYVNNIAKMNDNRGYGQTGTLEQTLTFDKTIGKLKLTAMAGQSALNTDLLRTYGHAEGFSAPYFKVLTQGTSGISATSDEYHSRLLSYFGRLILNYDDKYLLTATMRRDGSSRFSPQHRWGNFPSVAAAWKVHNESFMSGLADIISQLKIRASYGVLGNQEIGDYLYQGYINAYGHYVFNGQLAPGASQYVFNTPDIRWEEARSSNIGLDFGFLKNKILFTAEYFYRKTDDILVSVPVPGVFGSYPWESPTINGAALENKGLEFSASYNNFDGEFKYSIGANLSTLKNKVLSLGYGNNPIYGEMSRTDVGREVGEFYGWLIDGIFQNQSEIDALNAASPIGRYQEVQTSPGDIKFKDINGRDANGKLTGKPDGMINDDDRTYLGSAYPKFTFGFNFSGSYKNFDLTVTAHGVYGNKINNAIRNALISGAGWDNYSRELLDRWTPQNTNTNVPRVVIYDPNHNMRASSRLLEDGSFLKISNVELGYTLPSALLSLAKISSLRLYVSAQNLLTFTKYTGFDPDFNSESIFSRGTDHANEPNKVFNAFSGGLPNPRTITIGVKASF